jgi:hypothetical protein
MAAGQARPSQGILFAMSLPPETNPLADLDCEKVPTWDEQTVQATPLRASTCAGS